jgi:PAS domain S-box-containing protein
VYAVAAAAWIAFSDNLVALIAGTPDQMARLSILKGFGFVLVTATLLHGTLRGAFARERDARRQLAASEALLRAVTDAITDPVFLKDRESRWRFANPATLAAIGKTREAVIGRNDLEIYSDPEVATALLEADRRVMDSGIAAEVEETVETPTGPRIFMTAKAPLRDERGRVIGVVGIARDVTESRRLQAQVQASARLESVGRLAGGIAHDFNNLLTVILGCAGSVERRLEADPVAAREEVGEIRSAATRAAELTRQLLAFARKQVIAPVPLDLNEVVRGSERLLRRVLGEDVRLDVRLQPDLWPVKADAAQLEQVILNLAVNAREAMPHGGELGIETRNLEPGAGELQRVALVIRDTGEGMSPEVRRHAFEPFFTTKGTGKGTGLGLATVYGIVAQLDGQIQLDSEPGAGTTFTLFFPRTTGAPAPGVAPATAPPGSPPAPCSGRLLVIEDDPFVRAVTVRALRGAGYAVDVAADGAEALALSDAALAAVDLVVSDLVMPGADGRSVVRALRERRPGLKALFVSGYSAEALADREPQDAEFLPKPFTIEQLESRVGEMLSGRR